MTSKVFIKLAMALIDKHNPKQALLNDSCIIKTKLGELYIKLDPTPKIKVYTVFMRFIEKDEFDMAYFDRSILYEGSFNRFSLKWNIHKRNPHHALNELEYRLKQIFA